MPSDDISVSRRQFVKRSATATAALSLAPSLVAGCREKERASLQATYTLDIKFTGLCLFVLDTKDDQLRVLLPATGGADGVPKHEVRFYSDGWGDQGIRAPSSFDAKTSSIEKERVLDFQDGLQNFSSIFGPKVNSDLFTSAIDPAVLTGRVSSPGGNLSRTGRWRGVWDVASTATTLTLAPWAIWTTQVDATDLQPLVLDPATPLKIALTAGKNAQIEVRHAPPHEQGPTPSATEPHVGDPSMHFAAYSKLFKSSINAMLKWRDDSGTPYAAGSRGMSPYTCMTGGGDG